MNIGEFYQFVNFCLNTYQQGAYTPDEFNIALAGTYLDILKVKLGLPEDFQQTSKYGADKGAMSRQQASNSQTISDDISNFLETVPLTRVGRFTLYPDDYVRFSGAEYDFITTSNIPFAQPTVEIRYIKPVTDSEKKFRQSNSIIFPSFEYPILAFEADGLNVLPKEIQKFRLTYYRLPVQPKFGYTIDPVTNDVIYDPNTSVQLEYKPILHNDYAVLLMKYIGLNIRDADIVNFAEKRQIQGQ